MALERKAEVAAVIVKAAEPSARATRAAEAQREALLDHVEAMHVIVKVISVDQVRSSAAVAYEAYKGEPVYVDAPQRFLDRIAVNFIRHTLTFHDAALDEVAIRIGAENARVAIRRKMFTAIATAYPDYAAECDRQRYNG